MTWLTRSSVHCAERIVATSSSYGVREVQLGIGVGMLRSSFARMRRVSAADFDGFGTRGRAGGRFAMPPIVARPYLQYAGGVRL